MVELGEAELVSLGVSNSAMAANSAECEGGGSVMPSPLERWAVPASASCLGTRGNGSAVVLQRGMVTVCLSV